MNATSQTSDFKSTNDEKNKTDEKIEKVEAITTNILFSIMIVITIIGTCLLSIKIQEYVSSLQKIKSDYVFPRLQDFYISFLAMPILSVIYIKLGI